MSGRASFAALVLVLGVFAAGCGNSTAPTSFLAFVPGPAPTIYTGSIVDSVEGSGTLTVALTGAGGLVSGTWDMSFAGKKADPTYTISGPEGAAYSATVTTCKDNGSGLNCVSACAFHFSGSLTASTLVGTYSATSDQSCIGRTGNINTTKR